MDLADISAELVKLRSEADAYLADIKSASELDDLRRDLLGRKGRVKDLRRSIGEIDGPDRPEAGRLIAEFVESLEAEFEASEVLFANVKQPIDPSFDPTLPGVPTLQGGLHPIIQMMYDLNDAFAALNFDVYSGPEITSEEFDFDHLNFPADHPARESMDTFWLSDWADQAGADRLCLRPHLTGASIRYMRSHPPPHRFVYPGRVYRNESTDARHERAFFQYEALITGQGFPFGAGKLLVSTILDTVFGTEVSVRMRTGFFPFVEPGFEIDMECQVCGGRGCAVCKGVGWLEVMPGGVPHPNVLRAAGIDPDIWSGFYINVGLDRLVMMRYGIDDVRLFNSADLRFLDQFK